MSTITSTAALLAEVFPGTRVSRPDYLTWLYEQSPFGVAVEANLDDKLGRAGHYALVPILLTRDGVNRRGALSLNTAVHERARGGGVFVSLASQALAEASRQGVEVVVGVANANSTPGFIRHLDFELLMQLPANVMIPLPGYRDDIRSSWSEPAAFDSGGLAAASEALLSVPSSGEARRWTPETLRWRLGRPGVRYALHRRDDMLAVSCEDRRHGVPVAILLKVFTAGPMSKRAQRALVRAVCYFHRAPLALHVGLNDLVDFSGLTLPQRFRESPLNLIYRSLSEQNRPASVVRFEFLDFDAY